jgi:dihydrofolate reductase
MGKLVAAINMTLDGFWDHPAIIPDEEIHQHYADLLRDADTILYGRITLPTYGILANCADKPYR